MCSSDLVCSSDLQTPTYPHPATDGARLHVYPARLHVYPPRIPRVTTPHHTDPPRPVEDRGIPLARDDPSRRVRSPRRETTTTRRAREGRGATRRSSASRARERAFERARGRGKDAEDRDDDEGATVDIERMRARMRECARTRASARVMERLTRSEERRVGKECRSRWSPYH